MSELGFSVRSVPCGWVPKVQSTFWFVYLDSNGLPVAESFGCQHRNLTALLSLNYSFYTINNCNGGFSRWSTSWCLFSITFQ